MSTTNSGNQLANMYRSKHEPENARVIGGIVWHTILFSTFILTCVAIGFGIWELIAAFNTLATAGDQAPVTYEKTLDQDQLHATIEEFNFRRANFESAKTATSTITDPSR